MAHALSEAPNLHGECAQVTIPKDLLADIDALVGEQDRNGFLVEVLRREVNRRQLLQFLSSPEPLLKDEDLRLEQERLGDWLPKAE
jgi:hypothetical protein